MRALCAAVLSAAIAAAAPGGACADPLLVFAAASLREALDAQITSYGSPGRPVVASYASTSTLARQIERGAPAEVFISADIRWMDYLAARKLIDRKSRVRLLSNRLVLVSAAGNPISLVLRTGFPLGEALGATRLAMADPDHVPAGTYAKAALESLGVWAEISGRITRSENVRAALVLVARGEAPLGIVYRTDALAEERVRVVDEFPSSSHPEIVYPAAVTASSGTTEARRLLDFLRSPPARAIWKRYGFVVLG